MNYFVFVAPLNGLSEYQRWTSDEVEPFLKVFFIKIPFSSTVDNVTGSPVLKELRKAIKAQKPSNLEDYCVEFCYARAAGRPIPEIPER